MSRIARLLKILSLGVFVLLAVVIANDTRIATRSQFFRPPPKVVKELEYLLFSEKLDYVRTQSKHYIKYYPYSGELFGLSAVANSKTGNYALSESDSDRAILINPSVGWIYLARGLNRLESLRLERSLNEFDCARQLGCDNAIFYASKASCELMLNLVESSWSDSKKALNLNPRNTDALIVQSELLLARLQLGQVLSNLKFAEEIHRQNVYEKAIKLCALSKLGKSDETKSEAEQLLKQTRLVLDRLKKNNSRWSRRGILLTRTARGYACLYSDKLNSAQAEFAIVLNMVPGFPFALEGQAQVLNKRGEFKQAISLLNKLNAEKNNRSSALLLKAQILHQQRKSKEALALLKLIKSHGCASSIVDRLESRILKEMKLSEKSRA